jgi:hypothetical protein
MFSNTRRQCGIFGMPRGLGLATPPPLQRFSRHLEQRIRCASSFSVTFQPTRRARASGSISRTLPHAQRTRRKWPGASSIPNVRQCSQTSNRETVM